MNTQCRYCLRTKHPTVQINRFGGGSYKRGGRYYRGALCVECLEHLVEGSKGWTGQIERYDVSSLNYQWTRWLEGEERRRQYVLRDAEEIRKMFSDVFAVRQEEQK